jgi:hypothetical protein
MPQRRSCRACYYAHTWSIENSHVVHFPDALHLTHLRPCALNLLPLVPNNADQKGGKKTQQDGTQRPSLRQRIGLPTPCQNSITLYSKLMDQKMRWRWRMHIHVSTAPVPNISHRDCYLLMQNRTIPPPHHWHGSIRIQNKRTCLVGKVEACIPRGRGRGACTCGDP